MSTTAEAWPDQPSTHTDAAEIMYVDVGGYEGPLDLLLDLARRQKVDLSQISVLALAEQYLAFILTIREKRIELAADYLVMAAWLAYLKSRLMVPQTAGDEEPAGEQMAALLQFRLKRLEAMRRAAAQLLSRPHLGIDIHPRGQPEAIAITRRADWEASLFDLLKAYGRQRERSVPTQYSPFRRQVLSLQEARESLSRLIGDTMDWISLDYYLTQYLSAPEERASVMASSFSASLELARTGQVELRQSAAFSPLFLRRRAEDQNRP